MEIETCPITLIPTEVLASILVFSVKDLVDRCSNGNRYNQDYVYPFDPTWSDHVRITMVCSTWRQTALITPEFWSSLPFLQLANLQRFPEMLSRSGATPLRLRIAPSSWINITLIPESRLAQLFDPARLQEFNSHAEPGFQEMLLEFFPKGETPLFEILVLGESERAKVSGHSPSDYLETPRHILNSPRPSLRVLRMKLCHFPWDSAAFIPPYPNLVHLTLDQLAPNIPIVKVLSILSLSPKLEHVSLSNDPTLLPQHHHSSSSSLDGCSIQAALPRLTTLGLTGDASFVCGLLSRISHPPCTNLRIVCKGEWPAVEGSHPYSPLLDLVGITTTNPLYLASVVSLQIKGPMSMFNDDLYLVLKMHNQASNTEEVHRGAPSLLPSLLPIKSVGSLRIAASASLAGGASFFGALQIQGLLELRVELEHRGERGTPLAQCNWGAFFRRHPFISSLHITGWKYAAVKILQGLHGDISVPADSRSRDNLGAGNQRTTIGSRIMRGFKHMALKSQSTSSQDDEGLADIDTSHSNVASLLSPAAALRHLTFVSGLRCLSILGPDDIDIALGVTRAIRAVFVARRDQAPLSTLKVEGLTVPFSKFPYMKEISLVRKEVEGVCRGKTEFCWE